MKTLMLIFQLLQYMPAIRITDAPPPAPAAAAEGSGILIVAACRPGTDVIVQPVALHGVAGADGVARIPAPAQLTEATPYTLWVDDSSTEFNGTLVNGEVLSATCP